MEKAIKELEELFATTAKGNVVYFNDVTYTPIPRPVVEAVEAIANEYPDLRFQIGMYSVKVMDKEPITIQSSKKKELESSRIGDIHDDFVMNKISEDEVTKNLKDSGYNSKRIKELIKKWKPDIIKSSKYTPDDILDACRFDLLDHTVFLDREECKNAKCGTEELYDLLGEVFPMYLGIDSYSKGVEVLRKAKNPIAKEYLRMIETAKDNAEFTDKFYNSFKVHKKVASSIKSSLSDYFPVSAEEAEELNELANTFTDKSELRNVLEDYFHIYDDYAQMSVQDFDRYLADYFDSEENDTNI